MPPAPEPLRVRYAKAHGTLGTSDHNVRHSDGGIATPLWEQTASLLHRSPSPPQRRGCAAIFPEVRPTSSPLRRTHTGEPHQQRVLFAVPQSGSRILQRVYLECSEEHCNIIERGHSGTE